MEQEGNHLEYKEPLMVLTQYVQIEYKYEALTIYSIATCTYYSEYLHIFRLQYLLQAGTCHSPLNCNPHLAVLVELLLAGTWIL